MFCSCSEGEAFLPISVLICPSVNLFLSVSVGCIFPHPVYNYTLWCSFVCVCVCAWSPPCSDAKLSLGVFSLCVLFQFLFFPWNVCHFHCLLSSSYIFQGERADTVVFTCVSVCLSPWYNRTGWLGIKHQLAYLLVCLHTLHNKSAFKCSWFWWYVTK